LLGGDAPGGEQRQHGDPGEHDQGGAEPVRAGPGVFAWYLPGGGQEALLVLASHRDVVAKHNGLWPTSVMSSLRL